MKRRIDFWAELGWKEWTGLAAAVLVVLFVAAKLSPEFRQILGGQNTASWVQAIGSITAILAAWKISTRGLKEQKEAAATSKREAAEERIQQLKALNQIIRRLAGNGLGTSNGIRARSSPESKVQYAFGRLRPMRAAAAALDRIEFHHIPYAYICVHALNVANLFNSMIDYTEEISKLDFDTTFLDFTVAYEPKIQTLMKVASHIERDLDTIQALVDAYDGVQDPNVEAGHL